MAGKEKEKRWEKDRSHRQTNAQIYRVDLPLKINHWPNKI